MRWERDVPMASMARYRIGGPAPRLGRPESVEQVREAVGALRGEAYRVLGTGANVLISDEGVPEPVLVLGGELDRLQAESGAIEAGAGARLPALAGLARRQGRVGFHFLEAVPGTVGGGLRMNAGSRDTWLWHRVEWAEAVTAEGVVERVTPEESGPGYRSVDLPESWIFVGARFCAPPGDDPARISAAHLAFRERKVHDQVYELPSVGSTWKNPEPPDPPAWRVVDRVGMRGQRIGGAQIAERHANFIVNLGDARAEDVVALMLETRRRARESLGVELEPEIRLWGFETERLAELGVRT